MENPEPAETDQDDQPGDEDEVNLPSEDE